MRGKVRLGKGLNALIPAGLSDDAVTTDSSVFQEIDLDLIEPNPFQPRIVFDEDSFEDLKKSIKEKGVIQPVLLRPIDHGRYQLVAGERRFRAAFALRIERIPAYIREVTTDQEMLEIALIENVQREHLNPVDLARGYQRLVDELGITQEEVAKKIGKDRTTVTNIIRLLKLPEKIQESLQHGEIKEGHARALLRISNPQQQTQIWRKAVKESLSVRKVELLARKSLEKVKNKTNTVQTRKPVYLTKIETKLREIFGTQVKIRTKKEGGAIEVSFYSAEDLERLIGILDQIKY